MRFKFCPQCEQNHPAAEFGRNRSALDGLHYYCKACAAEKQRKWADSNRETVRRMRRDYLSRIRAQNEGKNPYE